MTPLTEVAWTQFWQFTAVAAGAGLIARFGCRNRPHLAHVLWLVVLVKCLTPPLLSSPTSLFSWATRESTGAIAQRPVGADVADIPSTELQAAGDPSKRYFLIGPKKKTQPPAEGYGLLLIMPGGDGSADFHPFVKRIYKNALSDGYLAAQPVAVRWAPDQQIVWPTKSNPVAGMKFCTEEFLGAVIEDAAKKYKLDRTRVFSLSWSSSGPAAYAASLQPDHGVRGSFIAMSVFKPKQLPPLKQAKGHAYYLYHSQQDRVCPFRMANLARDSLAENGAKVHLETYAGGHGWRGNVFHDIRMGVEWLEQNREKVSKP